MIQILGIDLGVSSIGWALIKISEFGDNEIINIGSRIIPLTVDETTGFTKGNGETPDRQRTAKRTMRKMNDRSKRRKKKILFLLDKYKLNFPDELLKLDPLQLWKLRSDAASGKQIKLQEIGRVIYHINQRRGYRDSKSDGADSSKSEYLANIRGRAGEAKAKNQTPGQYFYEKLEESVYESPKGRACTYRIKEQVFPRKSYHEELLQIFKNQQQFYPEILTDDIIAELADAVFFQRPLKSCKHLVSLCDFESKEYKNKKGEIIKAGPRVAPASSPIAQVCRLWEAINNIQLKNYKNKNRKSNVNVIPGLFENDKLNSFIYPISLIEKEDIFNFLNFHELMKTSDLFKLLGLKKEDGFSADKNIAKGLKGNQTRCELAKALGNLKDKDKFLEFNLDFEEYCQDKETGEILLRVSNDYLRQPLYQLWHTIYSIDDFQELKNAINKKFGINDEGIIDNLFKLDFRGKGYSNKSAKFICKILPYLMQGQTYSQACETVGIRHSDYMTREENESRILNKKLTLLKKGELKQPVVEKILNQLIHQINAISEKYGMIDEIHVELARELKQNKEERSNYDAKIRNLENENKRFADDITDRLGMRATKNRIQKYRMYEESSHCCMYCGQPVGLAEFLSGIDAEKEHIIPRSLFFNDGFSNKVCSCRKCNAEKGQKTGYDFMKEKGEVVFNAYLDRIETLFSKYKSSKGKEGISKTKHDLLLTSRNEIPQDFIDRDLRQSQYIARKAVEILKNYCSTVIPTSGAVTSFLRHVWGYDEILHNLNLQRYSEAEQTENIQINDHNKILCKERIINWSKRLDHRHHAVDALVIALTTSSLIQRLNTLSATEDKEKKEGANRNLEKWVGDKFHFSFNEVTEKVENIAVSFKNGKKIATPGKRKIKKGDRIITVQDNILVPRGALTEESVYGLNKVLLRDQPLKYVLNHPENIVDERNRDLILQKLKENDFDFKKTLASLKKSPVKNQQGDEINTFDCWENKIVLKRPIETITLKNKDKIVDDRVRSLVNQRFIECDNNDKKFQQSLSDKPIYIDKQEKIPVKSVKCFTGITLDSITAVKKDSKGRKIGFSKYGSNHHVAIYENAEGKYVESVVPFWHAVQRKKHSLPVIIKNPDQTWFSINDSNNEIPEEILSEIPLPNLRFIFSMEINDMFIMGMTNEEFDNALNNNDISLLCDHLFRVQKLSSSDYNYKKHTTTVSDTDNSQMKNGSYIRITSERGLRKWNPIKVRIDRLGLINKIDS